VGETSDEDIDTLIHCTQRKGTGQDIPAQASAGRDGPRRLVFPDFQTIGTWRW